MQALPFHFPYLVADDLLQSVITSMDDYSYAVDGNNSFYPDLYSGQTNCYDLLFEAGAKFAMDKPDHQIPYTAKVSQTDIPSDDGSLWHPSSPPALSPVDTYEISGLATFEEKSLPLLPSTAISQSPHSSPAWSPNQIHMDQKPASHQNCLSSQNLTVQDSINQRRASFPYVRQDLHSETGPITLPTLSQEKTTMKTEESDNKSLNSLTRPSSSQNTSNVPPIPMDFHPLMPLDDSALNLITELSPFSFDPANESSSYCQVFGSNSPRPNTSDGVLTSYAASSEGLNFQPSGVYVQHTDDAASKESQFLRRRCFNCQTTEPPSWRRSTLNPGKIVCNKCGLYERTHTRPRPLRFDELRAGTKFARKTIFKGPSTTMIKLSGGIQKPGRQDPIRRRDSALSLGSSNGVSDGEERASGYSSNSQSTFGSPDVVTPPLSSHSHSRSHSQTRPQTPSTMEDGIRIPAAPFAELHHAHFFAGHKSASLSVPGFNYGVPPFGMAPSFLSENPRRGSLPSHLMVPYHQVQLKTGLNYATPGWSPDGALATGMYGNDSIFLSSDGNAH